MSNSLQLEQKVYKRKPFIHTLTSRSYLELNKRSTNICRQSLVDSATQKQSLFYIIIHKCFMNARHALIIRCKFLQGQDNILYIAIPTVTPAELLMNAH